MNISAETLPGARIGARIVQAIVREFNLACQTSDDSTGWIVTFNDGQRGLVLTSFGQPFVAKRSTLVSKLSEYRDLAHEARRALADLEVVKPLASQEFKTAADAALEKYQG